MSTPNAKICPRCQHVVPAEQGVCGHCGRLFRTPLAQPQPFDANKTMMFYDAALPLLPVPPPRPLPRILRLRRWVQRLRLQAHRFLNPFT